MAILVIVAVVMAAGSSVGALEKNEVLDMSYVLDNATLNWPGTNKFQAEVLHRGRHAIYPWFENNQFCTPEHIGTHLDAPAHFGQGKWRVDDIPINRLIAPAVKIDAFQQAANNADYQLTIADIMAWEEVNGQIPDGCILFYYTGWGLRWPDRLAFFGSADNETYLDDQGNSVLHFPGLAPDAATWLVGNRDIYGFATETNSVDFGPSVDVQSHQTLFGANIYALENVANMDKLPTTGAKVHALPIRLGDGSGAPVRIVAMLDEDTSSGAPGMTSFTSEKVVVALMAVVLTTYVV